MSVRIAQWFAVISVGALVLAPGCAKDETDGQAPTTNRVDEGAASIPTPVNDTKRDPVLDTTATTTHDERVENAKKAIPSIAADGTTNAAVKAPVAGEPKTLVADMAAIKAAPVTAKAAPAAGGVKTVASTPTYVVTVDAPAGAAGKDGAVKVIVRPKTGWKINLDFPTRLTIEPPADVSVAKKSQKKADAVEFSEKKGATWNVSYKPNSAGNKKFSGELRFAVCTDVTCDPKRASLAFAVDVK